MTAIILLLLAITPTGLRHSEPVKIVVCDEIEVNRVIDWDDTDLRWQTRLRQVIAWRHYDEPRRRYDISRGTMTIYPPGRHVMRYTVYEGPVECRSRGGMYSVTVQSCDRGRVRYFGRRLLRTCTMHDPEMDDREWWPLELRDQE